MIKQKKDRTYWFFLLLIPIGFSPWIITKLFEDENFQYSGSLGDTIGGITGPLVAAFSSFLVYIAFKEQVKANQLVQDHFTIDGIYEELDALEGYADKLEEQLYETTRGQFGKSFFDETNFTSLILRSWAYRISVIDHLLIEAEESGNKKVYDRVANFITDRLKPLLEKLNLHITDTVDEEARIIWGDAYLNFSEKWANTRIRKIDEKWESTSG